MRLHKVVLFFWGILMLFTLGITQTTQNFVGYSQKAFTINERDLIPEGITYDPVDDCFYLGSAYKCKIIKVDGNGKSIDFIDEKQDGLRTVLGMKVDAKQRILWANSVVGNPPPKEVNPEEVGLC